MKILYVLLDLVFYDEMELYLAFGHLMIPRHCHLLCGIALICPASARLDRFEFMPTVFHVKLVRK